MSTRAVIDISGLPHHEFDTYDPVWWGNNLLLAIETSMFAILIATYFYLRQNFALWPPPVAQLTATLDPLPQLTYGTLNTLLLGAWALKVASDRSAIRAPIAAPVRRRRPVVERKRPPRRGRSRRR